MSCLCYSLRHKHELRPSPAATWPPTSTITGDVWLYSVSRADSTFDYNVTQATSAPGSRLDWHLHPDGQQLLITDGLGYYQERGGPLQVMRKGDVIKSAPGVEHWHAATPDSGVVYLAIYGGEGTEWLEPVPEEAYLRGPADKGARGAIDNGPLLIQEQGSSTVGGTIKTSPGGDVTLVELPNAGLEDNTYFPMSDLNEAVAQLLLEWLAEKGLD